MYAFFESDQMLMEILDRILYVAVYWYLLDLVYATRIRFTGVGW